MRTRHILARNTAAIAHQVPKASRIIFITSTGIGRSWAGMRVASQLITPGAKQTRWSGH